MIVIQLLMGPLDPHSQPDHFPAAAGSPARSSTACVREGAVGRANDRTLASEEASEAGGVGEALEAGRGSAWAPKSQTGGRGRIPRRGWGRRGRSC